MDLFPPEVLHLVFAYLKPKELGQFRLACKTFNDISAYIVFRKIIFYLHVDDLRHLRHVSQQYPTCVRSLVYRGRTIVDEVTSDDFAEQHADYMILKYGKELENAAEDLRVQYAQYRSDLQTQRGLIENQDDFSCLAEVLASLPELQSLTVNPGVFFFPHDNPHKLKSPFDHLFNACSQNAGKGLIRHVVAMFSALRCAVAKIEVLRLGPVDWGVLDLIVGFHSTPPEALSSLRHLELVLTIPLGDRNPCQALACREMMRSGALREFLRSLPQLEVLNVDFSSIGHRRQFAASVDDIIPVDHTWNHLYSLALRNVEEGEQGFMSVMERHKRTLREVCLSNVRLATTSLPVLLDQIRDTMNLDYSCICGLIIGPPDAHGKKEWVLMRSELSGDWHRVINYCCCGSGSPKDSVCPLKEDWNLNWTGEDKIDYGEIYQYEARFRQAKPFPGCFWAMKEKEED